MYVYKSFSICIYIYKFTFLYIYIYLYIPIWSEIYIYHICISTCVIMCININPSRPWLWSCTWITPRSVVVASLAAWFLLQLQQHLNI